MTTHELKADVVHHEWNNAIPPRLDIDPGDTVVFHTRDAADGFYSPTSTAADVMRRVFKGHPLTGPVRVRGAQPGDTLVVEILDMRPAPWGWTQIRPGRGLLPPSEFGEPFLQIWDLSDGTHARMDRRVAIPIAPSPGVMGVALGIAGGNCAAFLLKVPPAIPLDWVALGLLICSLVGIVFGTYPAVKAANLDPIESLLLNASNYVGVVEQHRRGIVRNACAVLKYVFVDEIQTAIESQYEHT